MEKIRIPVKQDFLSGGPYYYKNMNLISDNNQRAILYPPSNIPRRFEDLVFTHGGKEIEKGKHLCLSHGPFDFIDFRGQDLENLSFDDCYFDPKLLSNCKLTNVDFSFCCYRKKVGEDRWKAMFTRHLEDNQTGK